MGHAGRRHRHGLRGAGDTFAISADTTLYGPVEGQRLLVSYVSGDPDEGSVTGGPETVAYGGRPAMGGVAARARARLQGRGLGLLHRRGWRRHRDRRDPPTPPPSPSWRQPTFTARFVADGAQTYDVAYVSAGGGTVDHALDAGIQVLGTDGVSGSTATPAPATGSRAGTWATPGSTARARPSAPTRPRPTSPPPAASASDTTFITARFVADGAQTYDVAYVSAGGGTVDHAPVDAGIQVLGNRRL